MKKITFLSILFWVTVCFAWSPPADKLPSIQGALANPAFMAVVAVKDGGGDAGSCPSGSNYLAAWDGDYAGQDKYICHNSQASQKDGTENGTIEIGDNYGSDGDNEVTITGADESIEWAVSSDDLIDESVGTVCITLYIDAESYTGNTQVFEVTNGNGLNGIAAVVNNGGSVWFYYYEGASYPSLNSAATVTLQTETTIKISWDQPNGDMIAGVGGTDTEDTEVTMSAPSAYSEMHIGESLFGGASTHTFYVTDIKTYSTYDATCE